MAFGIRAASLAAFGAALMLQPDGKALVSGNKYLGNGDWTSLVARLGTNGSLDAGFNRALATILDSNITTFIAASVLFFIGSGPVRGFALTLGIGIVTTVFTAFTLTRLMIAAWFRWFRPRTIPI